MSFVPLILSPLYGQFITANIQDSLLLHGDILTPDRLFSSFDCNLSIAFEAAYSKCTRDEWRDGAYIHDCISIVFVASVLFLCRAEGGGGVILFRPIEDVFQCRRHSSCLLQCRFFCCIARDSCIFKGSRLNLVSHAKLCYLWCVCAVPEFVFKALTEIVVCRE